MKITKMNNPKKITDLSGIYREGLGAVLIKVEWEITICPKPLLRPDLSGKGL